MWDLSVSLSISRFFFFFHSSEEHNLMWNETGGLACTFGSIVFYFCLLCMLEKYVFGKFVYRLIRAIKMLTVDVETARTEPKNDDVRAEEAHVNDLMMRNGSSSNALIIQNLRVLYGENVAVDRLSFTTELSTCFGLFGPNGKYMIQFVSFLYSLSKYRNCRRWENLRFQCHRRR